MTTVVTDPVLDANDQRWSSLPTGQRDELCRWIKAHGFDPLKAIIVELDCIDAPLLRVTSALDGYPLLSELPDAGPNEANGLATTTAEVLQRGPQPSWWKPNG